MNWAEQLEKLQQLHQQGALTDDEYAAAKARVIRDLGPSPTEQASQAARTVVENGQTALNQLRRSLTDRWFGGVSGGLAIATNIPTWAWRILFVMTAFLHGLGIIMYILMWIFLPLERPMVLARVTPAPASTPPDVPPPVPPAA